MLVGISFSFMIWSLIFADLFQSKLMQLSALFWAIVLFYALIYTGKAIEKKGP